MKDYRLSEIKEICELETQNGGCLKCFFYPNSCLKMFKGVPRRWDIEPRDMIELPCKEHFTYTHDNGHITENWRVFYRSELALIETAFFSTEPEADAFLAKLKGGKQ